MHQHTDRAKARMEEAEAVEREGLAAINLKKASVELERLQLCLEKDKHALAVSTAPVDWKGMATIGLGVAALGAGVLAFHSSRAANAQAKVLKTLALYQ